LKVARDKAAKILRGGEERTNWSILHRYINDCLPQPDGSQVPRYELRYRNPVLNPYTTYFNDAAKRAYTTKREREEEGKLDEIDYSNLIQINIQGIYTRYCDIPMGQSFYEYVRKNCAFKESLREDDWGTATESKPPKRGWAVEIRGFTFYTGNEGKLGGLYFVADTFLENLRSRKSVLSPGDDPASKRLPLDISHTAILAWDTKTISGPKVPEFRYISGGIRLNEVVKGGSQSGGGMGPGGTGQTTPGGGKGGAASAGDGFGGAGGGGGSGRSDWQGLGSALGGSGSSSYSPGGSREGDMPEGAGTVRGPSFGGGAGAGGGGGAASGESAKVKPGERQRTEFIIVLFWTEPLPTDNVVPEGGGGGGDPGLPSRGQ